jgi:hypothetical protein
MINTGDVRLMERLIIHYEILNSKNTTFSATSKKKALQMIDLQRFMRHFADRTGLEPVPTFVGTVTVRHSPQFIPKIKKPHISEGLFADRTLTRPEFR